MVNGEYFTLAFTNLICIFKYLKALNTFIYSFKNKTIIIKYIIYSYLFYGCPTVFVLVPSHLRNIFLHSTVAYNL